MSDIPADIYSRLEEEWHPTKNSGVTLEVFPIASRKQAWWLCSGCGNEWRSMVSTRVKEPDCPFCSGKRLVSGINDLATMVPDSKALWHPTKNETLRPDLVASGSGVLINWLCQRCGHEWSSRASTFNKHPGCPNCITITHRHKSFSVDERKYDENAVPEPGESVYQYKVRAGMNRSRPVTVRFTTTFDDNLNRYLASSDCPFRNRTDFIRMAVSVWLEEPRQSTAGYFFRRPECVHRATRLNVADYDRIRDLVTEASKLGWKAYPLSMSEYISDACLNLLSTIKNTERA